jgi:TonB family protein
MKHQIVPFLPPVALLMISAPAAAEWRCDCTTITDSCNAQVSVQQNWIDVSTDTQQCSRVDYFVDGMPFVSVVVGGQQRQDWINRSEEPKVLVQSCQVCKDNADTPGTAAAQTASDTGAAGELQPLIAVQPAYPEQTAAGRTGFVDVAFDVNESGDVENARVTSSEPQGLFDAAALAAVKRWRYPAEADRETVSLTQRLNFSPDTAAQRQAQPEASARRVPLTGPRSECVRQDTAYNFGEMVEIGLINACDAPLIVFACAEGTGTYQGRWACTDSEQQAHVLVGQGDGRVGTSVRVETPNGQRDFRYADNFFLTRAPNTQYWWLACTASDNGCRDDARQWARSLDNRLASVDPQARSPLTVARSY